jgi:hypothetical protein
MALSARPSADMPAWAPDQIWRYSLSNAALYRHPDNAPRVRKYKTISHFRASMPGVGLGARPARYIRAQLAASCASGNGWFASRSRRAARAGPSSRSRAGPPPALVLKMPDRPATSGLCPRARPGPGPKAAADCAGSGWLVRGEDCRHDGLRRRAASERENGEGGEPDTVLCCAYHPSCANALLISAIMQGRLRERMPSWRGVAANIRCKACLRGISAFQSVQSR